MKLAAVDFFSRDHSQKNAGVSISSEALTVLLCAKLKLDAREQLLLRTLVASPDFEWPSFLRLAAEHRVTPRVHGCLSTHCASLIPHEFRLELSRRLKVIAARNFRLLNEMIRLQRLFCSAQVKVVWFKGPVLAFQAYGNPTQREFLDLDVLIDHNYLESVYDILGEQGYRPVFDLTAPRAQRLHGKISNELAFQNLDRAVSIDVHWGLTDKRYSFSERAPLKVSEIRLAGQLLTTFETNDNLCYLCYHGCKHGWRSLQWICDVASLFLRLPGEQRRLLLDRPMPIGTHRMLEMGLALAYFLQGTPATDNSFELIDFGYATPRTQKEFINFCFNDSKLKDARIYLASMESWKDRMRYLAYMVLQPTAIELQSANLPEQLLFLYTGLRVVRLMRKWSSKYFEASILGKAGGFRI